MKKLYYSCKDFFRESWDVIAPPPPKIMFELTNACNHKCIFCANKNMKRKIGFMKKEIFYKIAREAFDAGIYEIALYSTGESLLHREIVDFVKIAKNIGFSYIYLASNGSLLNAKLSEELIESGLDSLRISINAGTKESYKKIHGRDHFDKVIENIRIYDRIRKIKNINTLLSVSCVLTTYTMKEKNVLKNIVSPYVDAIKWTDVRVQGGYNAEIINKIANIPRDSDMRYKLKPCGLLWEGMHITYDGYLTLCCVDFDAQLTVGNVIQLGLMNCWNNENMQRHRHIHLNLLFEKESLCYKCLTGEK